METEVYMKYKSVSANLEKSIKHYEGIFDLVRIVDPIKKSIISFKDYDEIPDNAMCYSLWHNNKICKDCITINAFFKIQHNGDYSVILIKWT